MEHPVRFVALNAEEIGLQGAKAFGDRAAAEGVPYAGGIYIDSVGALYDTPRLVVNADGASAYLQDLLLGANEDYGLGLDLQPRQNPNIVGDEAMLSQRGIPTVLVASVLYGSPLVNQSNDVIAQVDLEFVAATAQLVLLATGALAAG